MRHSQIELRICRLLTRVCKPGAQTAAIDHVDAHRVRVPSVTGPGRSCPGLREDPAHIRTVCHIFELLWIEEILL